MLIEVDKELQKIVENIGFEQILVDAGLTVEDIVTILCDLGYLDLEQYEQEHE